MKILDKVKNSAMTLSRTVNKHSPAILTGLGIVGLGGTAYLSYKAHAKVELIVEDVEQQREEGYEVDRAIIVRDVAAAVALPVSVGVLSVGVILASYKIQNNRIGALAGTLAVTTAEHAYYRNKYKDVHGEKEYNKFFAPVEEQEVAYTDDKGKEKTKEVTVKKELTSMHGKWFDQSSEYSMDDHQYNKAFVDSVINKLELIYFQRGVLLMNEVLDEFGFETTREGALLGWSTTNGGVGLESVTHNLTDNETGERKPHLYINWNSPRYIFGDFPYGDGLSKWK